MNLDIFKKPDSSGKLAKEKYVINNHPEEYDYINLYCKENNIDVTFKEKVYLCINDIKQVPNCKNQNCNNLVKFRNTNLGYREYCSNKCISSDPNIKNLKTQKSIDKYGTKTPAESKIIKDKIVKTNLEKYGFNSAMCLKETQDKSKQTLLNNYGIDNPSKSNILLEKRIKSFKENIDVYKENYKNTSMTKYGVEHPWMDKNIHNKSVISSFDIKNEITEKLIKEKLKNHNLYELIKIDYTAFKKNIFIKCPSEHIFEINRENLYQRNLNGSELCTVCNPVCRAVSGLEKNLLSFIKMNYNGEIVENSRKIIKPFEIDIYIPEFKLAIEFNGLYWHSILNKEKNYHLNKFNMCDEQGIKLITIWEDDWILKRDICESFILNQLGKSNKIYARKCTIREIDYKTSQLFLNNNHFQGDCKSSVRIGLFYDNKLVSLMTFSKLRLALGGKHKDGYFELLRFCNLCNYSVIGGASKIFKYFLNKYNPIQVESFSDNLISIGALYEKLGFKYKHTSEPGYWYVIDNKREHRFNWRKSKLKKLGADTNKTEWEIMLDWGFYRIYNGGNRKWIYIQKHII